MVKLAVKCAVCGEGMIQQPHGRTKKYCGAACRQVASRQRRRGEPVTEDPARRELAPEELGIEMLPPTVIEMDMASDPLPSSATIGETPMVHRREPAGTILPADETSFPRQMINQVRWVRHTNNGVPLRAGSGAPASSVNPFTWGSYRQAEDSPHGVGIGFVLERTGIVCIDLDHCRVPQTGEVTEWAAELVSRAPSTYVEISRSGTGVHIWGTGHLVTGRKIRGDVEVEMYGAGRYIAMGTQASFAPSTLADIQPLIEWILEVYG